MPGFAGVRLSDSQMVPRFIHTGRIAPMSAKDLTLLYSTVTRISTLCRVYG